MDRLTVAIAAQSFGFGPASKAVSIARRLRRDPRISVVALGCGVAHAFFAREGLARGDPLDPADPRDAPAIDAVLADCDALVSALDPLWLERAPPGCRRYLVDSLGFMWTEAHFAEHPWLRRLDGYFVQDLFGAATALRARGVANLRPVAAVIDLDDAPSAAPTGRDAAGGLVGHLGGLFNIFDPAPVEAYAEGVSGLLRDSGLPLARLATSAQGARLPCLAALGARQLGHGALLRRFAEAKAVASSPGLTTLLELAALGRPLLPLPPQNLSQALIVAKVAEAWPEAPEIWRWLSAAYALPPGLPEPEGVARVQAAGARVFAEPAARRAYLDLLRAAAADPRPLPRWIGPEGAQQVAAQVLADLDARAPAETAPPRPAVPAAS